MIWYKIINTPLGNVVLGGREGRICFCHFALPSLEAVLRRVAEDFPGEAIGEETVGKDYSLQGLLCGRGSIFRWEDFLLNGTPLQVAVWREIYNLQPGEVISYSSLASRCGYPKAVRAVATAVGKNPISLIIPCHRVLRQEAFRKEGGINADMLGNYGWGRELKRKILEWEGII